MIKTFLLVLTLVLSIFTSPLLKSEEKQHLVILNWSEYLNADLIAAFEKKHNAVIKEVYFESDDSRDEILLQTGGKGYDVIMVNGSAIASYIKRGYITPFDHTKVDNLKYVDPRWRTAFKHANKYGVPYFWGTLGIAYRKDLVKEPIDSWMQFFNPAEELQGKILVVKSNRDVIGMALKALGYSTNSENREEILAAEKLLKAQKPHVAKYGYITLSEDSTLVSGEIVAASIYGGDALNVAEHNENIVYVLPKEGGNIWVDYFSISAKAKKPELAHAFLNFINEPKWAAINAEEMYLASPNFEARKSLSEELLNDPVIYPDEEALARSEFDRQLSPRTTRLRSTIYSHIIK